MMQTIHNLRMKLVGCLLLILCSGNTLAAEEFRMSGKTGDILAGSRLMVVNGNHYYVDRQAPIHADEAGAPMTLEQLQPGMTVGVRVLPGSTENSVPHIKEIWIYTD
jgi:hypothetical protein